MEVVRKLTGWPGVQQPLVQILVVVASKQVRTLLADVKKGFVRSVFRHEWADPKAQVNPVKDAIRISVERESG